MIVEGIFRQADLYLDIYTYRRYIRHFVAHYTTSLKCCILGRNTEIVSQLYSLFNKHHRMEYILFSPF